MDERDNNLEAKIAAMIGLGAAGGAAGLYAARKAKPPVDPVTESLFRKIASDGAFSDKYLDIVERGVGFEKPPSNVIKFPNGKNGAFAREFGDFLDRMDMPNAPKKPKDEMYRKMLLEAIKLSDKSAAKAKRIPLSSYAMQDFAKVPMKAARHTVGGPAEIAAMIALSPAMMAKHGQEPLPTGGDGYGMMDWKVGGSPTTADEISRRQWEEEEPGSRLVNMTRTLNKVPRR